MASLRIAFSTTVVVPAVLALTTIDACAVPGPVGSEFPAEDRPVPADGWWKSCTDARGVTQKRAASFTVG